MIPDVQRRQWVCWRYEERDGKKTKVPYAPVTGRRASSRDPSTWGGYEEAVRAAKERGMSGVGFVFTAEDDLCGVDLDGCLDPETGEIERWVQEIVEELDSYTEISPSGTGVHILLRARLPEGRNRKGRFEAYDRGRFFTVTGRHLSGTPKTIEERQEALERVLERMFGAESMNGNREPTAASEGDSGSLPDAELVERAGRAKNGEKFRRLWAGDTSDYRSPSEADLALCGMLAFWTGGDAARIDTLFRQSGLYRDKWEREDYRDRTITEVLKGRTEFYTPQKSIALTNGHRRDSLPEEVGQLLSSVEPERVEWLWPGRLALGKIVLVDGDPGLGKSAMVLDLAARVSAGGRWPDGAACEAGGVVLLSAEDGLADTIRPRLDAAGADTSRILALATVPDEEGRERMLSIPEDLGLIERGIRRVGARLVVVDPLMAFLSGETNSHKDQDVRRALAPLAALAEGCGVCMVVIRHLNKSAAHNPLYRGGGSIGIIGAARMAFVVGKDPQDENRRVLAATKNNLAAAPQSLVFSLEEAENGSVRVRWLGSSEVSAKDLLAPAREEHADARDEAVLFLREILAGGPVPAKKVIEEADGAGIAEKTLRRAKKELGILVYRENTEGEKRGAGRWLWRLPEINVQDGQGGHLEEGGHLEREIRESRIDKRNVQDGQGDRLARHVQDGQGGRVSGVGGHLDEQKSRVRGRV